MALHLDLSTITRSADRDLLRRVPHDVAAYYQALPVAREEGRVTVVTPHPDNRAAIQVLARLLGAEVVPVSASEADVAAAIQQLYTTQALHRHVYSWTGDPTWHARVRAAAELFGHVLGLPTTHLSDDTRVPALAQPEAGETGALLVCRPSGEAQLAELMRQCPVSMLLVRGETHLPTHILVALRGYGSDSAAVREARPLLDRQHVAVTVLPLASSQDWSPERLLDAGAPARAHLDDCLRGLRDLPVAIRLRAGTPAEQLIAELSQSTVDLLVIAAEAQGEFVLPTLRRVWDAGVLPDQPVLIIRPPVTAPAAPAELP